jgi:hypothetical protein
MEPSAAWTRYLWVIVPVAVLLFVVYLSWPQRQSRSTQLALASFTLGLFGLAFCPLAPIAIYLGRKAIAGRPEPNSRVAFMSRAGIVLGTIGCIFLALVSVMAAIYLYGYLTGQYP